MADGNYDIKKITIKKGNSSMYKNNLRKIAQGALLLLSVVLTSENSFAVTAKFNFVCNSLGCSNCAATFSPASGLDCKCFGADGGSCSGSVQAALVFNGDTRVTLLGDQKDSTRKALSPRESQSALANIRTELPGLFENTNAIAVVEVKDAVFLVRISSDIYFNTLKSLSTKDKQDIIQQKQEEYLRAANVLTPTGCSCAVGGGTCSKTAGAGGAFTCDGCTACSISFGRAAGDPTGGSDSKSCNSDPVAF